MKMKKPALDIALTIVNYFLLVFLVVVMLYPFWSILVKSFMSDRDIISYPYAFFPKNFQFDGYKTIFVNKTYNFGRAFVNSVFVTVVDTVYQLAITTMAAYALSKKTLPGRGIIFFYFIFTMYFGGGMIPNYILMVSLGLRDTVASFILPGMISTYYVILMRSFFLSLPRELEEAGEIDGLDKWGVFWRIAIPLSKPIIATMALFYIVQYWNDWFDAFLYLDTTSKWPVAYYLRQLISSASGTSADAGDAMQIASNIKSCAMVLTSAPIICIYPFIQKYFVQGMMLGGVKG